jgi:D-alanine-D-alanine ligase
MEIFRAGRSNQNAAGKRNMTNKIRLGVLCGGRSTEHEVSIRSTKSIIEALDRSKYEIVVIGVDKKGMWHYYNPELFLTLIEHNALPQIENSSGNIMIFPGKRQLFRKNGKKISTELDVVFPVLHGTYGEDGTVQGLLKLLDVPFVGASVLGSAVGMDKEVMKRLLRDAGIPIGKYIPCVRRERETLTFKKCKDALGLPFFIKPVNCGSSVGVNKVRTQEEFEGAVADAFKFDNKILVEEAIIGREIECSVLGNDDPEASVPGEIILSHDFYSYETKYIEDDGAVLEIPAKLRKDVVKKVRDLAVKTYTTLCCEGLARVDFFLRDSKDVFVNEINTLPGFTSISMYPKLWEASGVPYPKLLDRLIGLALERHEAERGITTSRQ